MMKGKKLLAAGLVAASIISMNSVAFAAEGSTAALADQEYTLDDMLTYAIQDEYAAQAEYDAIMDAYGIQKPFSNIIKSEATHISLLLPLFDTYDITVPVNNAAAATVVPSTLEESYSIGVEAEIKNIAMYKSFLVEELPADVKVVFERLKAASENHLAAFENAEDGTLGLGNGKSNQSQANNSGTVRSKGKGGNGKSSNQKSNSGQGAGNRNNTSSNSVGSANCIVQ